MAEREPEEWECMQVPEASPDPKNEVLGAGERGAVGQRGIGSICGSDIMAKDFNR